MATDSFSPDFVIVISGGGNQGENGLAVRLGKQNNNQAKLIAIAEKVETLVLVINRCITTNI